MKLGYNELGPIKLVITEFGCSMFCPLLRSRQKMRKMLMIIFSSPLHCTSMCISTLGCSAFLFNKENGECGLGSKLNLQIAQAGDPQENLSEITVNTEGKRAVTSKQQ